MCRNGVDAQDWFMTLMRGRPLLIPSGRDKFILKREGAPRLSTAGFTQAAIHTRRVR